VGVFVALLVWLLLLPTRFIDQEGVRRPWWRNARFWAVLVTIAQIGVYVVWG
jgi:quinol-cytochrome oxidoreductase complex cytochrome b subunit